MTWAIRSSVVAGRWQLVSGLMHLPATNDQQLLKEVQGYLILVGESLGSRLRNEKVELSIEALLEAPGELIQFVHIVFRVFVLAVLGEQPKAAVRALVD